MPSPLALATSSSATFTDYLTGWGTIALAVATFTAVAISIRLARTDRNSAQAERNEHLRAQARLVIISGPGQPVDDQGRLPDPERVGDDYVHRFNVLFANHGDRPVLDVWVELWAPLATGEPTMTVHDRIVLAGQEQRYTPGLQIPQPEPTLRAWRVRWTDADGHQWFQDQASQPEPLPYKGDPPRAYPG